MTEPLREMTAEQTRKRTADVDAVRTIIGAYLRFNPWDDHWREPTFQAACAIVDRLTESER